MNRKSKLKRSTGTIGQAEFKYYISREVDQLKREIFVLQKKSLPTEKIIHLINEFYEKFKDSPFLKEVFSNNRSM